MTLKYPNLEWDLDDIEFLKTGVKSGVIRYRQKGVQYFHEIEVSVPFGAWIGGQSVRNKAVNMIKDLRIKLELENKALEKRQTVVKSNSTGSPARPTQISSSYTNKKVEQRNDDDIYDTTSIYSPLNPLSPLNSSNDSTIDEDNTKHCHSSNNANHSSSHSNSPSSSYSSHSSHSSYDSGHSHSSHDSGSSYSSSDSSSYDSGSSSSSDW